MSAAQGAQAPKQAPWWELRVRVPVALCEDLSALLIDDGAMGVQTLDAQAPEVLSPRGHASLGPASPEPRSRGSVAESAEAWAAGRAPASAATTATLVASYAGDLGRDDVLASARSTLGQLDQGHAVDNAPLQRRQDDGWAHAWKPYFKPQKLGRRLWVVPSWETKFTPPTGSLALHIDPGMAFGTGQHATTSLCMRALESHLDALDGAAKRELALLDVGCGSGILAMTALVLGVPRVVAVDVDPLAEAATLENLERMQLLARAEVSLTPIAEISGLYPLVTANILAPTLIAMAQPLSARVAPGGLLVLSGILVVQAEEVLAAFLRLPKTAALGSFVLHKRHQHEGWVALVLRRS